MKKTINLVVECPSCQGTGVYQGMGESNRVAVVCSKCNGTGAYQYSYEYKEFNGKKVSGTVDRVYLSGYGYKIGLGTVCFGDNKINMDKEGVSYRDFLNGKMPAHITRMACPMVADQGACHKVDGLIEKLGCPYGELLTKCRKQPYKSKCWELFNKK